MARTLIMRPAREPEQLHGPAPGLGIGCDRRSSRGGARDRLAGTTGRGGTIAGAAAHPRFGWASLTGGELRVARRAADGLTNRAIVRELSLSPHTVESHLRHAFRGLDIRSGVELTCVVLTYEPSTGE